MAAARFPGLAALLRDGSQAERCPRILWKTLRKTFGQSKKSVVSLRVPRFARFLGETTRH
jgi:hypothetical protein